MSPDGTPARGPRIGAFIRTEAGVSDILGMALFALRGNWLRSVLTALGVIIGIVAVTLMGTAINGIDIGFNRSLALLGDDVLYVQRWPWRRVHA